jgi:hypothetical protein
LIKLTANSLKDFQICALLYDYRFGNGKISEYVDIRDRRAQRFDETIKRVVAFFFYKKQAYVEPSYQALLNRWQKLWFSDETTAVDIATMKNEVVWGSDTSYTTQAATALLQFHEEFSNKPNQHVVLVDEKFCVPLNKEVALEGTFDVVLREKLEDGSFQYKVYKWITSTVKKPLSHWTFDMAFLDYAFRYRNQNKQINVSYYVWNFGSNSIGSKEILLERQDFSLLRYWAKTLQDTKTFAPRRGLTSYCKSCPYDRPCSKWQVPDENSP